ncbi:MAG: T9SS type A sorting domain-containing protein [Saprospiraceae bacterium]|nr:T9SS type A sorting domain-containing protein [Saprospiraceae bacterium]
MAANASGTWNGWEASVNCVTCPSVGGLMVSASNNIQINWNTNPTATSYYWEIGELGFVPGTGTAIDSSTTNGTSVEVVGLPTGKQLEVYVRANCASGETSSFGNGARFSTPATCGDDFYDTGGQVGTYNANESYATTICPQGDNQHVTVTFNGFQMDGCCDYLNVYNGPSQNHPIMAQLGGFPSLPLAYTSTDVSGCLTFYFYSDGSNQGAGWSADVSCDGCVLPLDLEANNVNSNGANISWQGNNDVDSYNYEIGLKGFVPGIGTAVVVNNTTSTSINISTLAAGVEYDAYVRSVCDGGTEVGDFAGPLTFETPVSCGSISYDSGGPDNDYGPNEDYYTLICPEVSGTKVWLDFTMFETQQCCDKLEILDGNTESAPVIGSFAGNTLPGAVAATNATGCVMLHFTSDATVHRSGWAADVYCTESSTEPDKLRSGSLLISPNPAKDVLYVTLPNEAGGDLQVVDVAGRVKWTGKAAAGKRQVTIPLEGLNSGIYLVRWQSEVSRFVVAP